MTWQRRISTATKKRGRKKRGIINKPIISQQQKPIKKIFGQQRTVALSLTISIKKARCSSLSDSFRYSINKSFEFNRLNESSHSLPGFPHSLAGREIRNAFQAVALLLQQHVEEAAPLNHYGFTFFFLLFKSCCNGYER